MIKKLEDDLAIFGGPKANESEFTIYNSIGKEEREAVDEVMRSGVLSKFLGCWHEDFYGGPKVQAFERYCESYFGVKHAITVNSWTSGLITALGAIDLEPGDEVIVSPWTMSASATSILHWNAIPVFADIEKETFNIDPNSIKKNITRYTKAIMAVDIFGHSADMDALFNIAEEYDLKIISDTAQSPGAYYKGKFAGTMADIGGFSLNYHKHIHTGEGGVLVTNDDSLAERMQLIRNHAEAVVGDKGVSKINNMLGYNFRLGEIECAIGLEQLKKLESQVNSRQIAAEKLNEGLENLSGLTTPIVKEGCTHAYYLYSMIFDSSIAGADRKSVAAALLAEGVPVSTYYQNLHLLPLYQKKIGYGSKGFPWTSDICHRNVSYEKGICPVAEKMNDECCLSIPMCVYDFSDRELENIVFAFQKVWRNIDRL